MKMAAALKELEKHQKAINASADMAEIVSARYGAHMTLFNMAVMTNDKAEIERLRGVLHDFLDQILDAGYDTHTHQREIKRLVQLVQPD